MIKEDQKTPKGSGIIVEDFSPFCEGDIEPQLNKRIHCLIDTDDDYMVYLDDDFYVQWSFTKKFKVPDSFSPIANRIGYLETISRTCLRNSQLEHFALLLAEGMARIVGDQDETNAR